MPKTHPQTPAYRPQGANTSEFECHTPALLAERDALREAATAAVEQCQYRTPAGSMNCRYCDKWMDHLGTYREKHEKDCPIVALRAALAEVRP